MDRGFVVLTPRISARGDGGRECPVGASMHENDVSAVILDAAIEVHRTLGPGLLESVYEVSLAHALRQRGLHVARQVPPPSRFRA